MKFTRVTVMLCMLLAIGCGDEAEQSTPSAPTTSPTATGATVDAAQRDSSTGARATGGLIDVPPATQPAVP